MDKITALTEAFEVLGLEQELLKYNSSVVKPIELSRLLACISKDTYNLAKDLGLSASKVAAFNKRMFANMPKGSRIDVYVLGLVGLKYCAKCCTVHTYDAFNFNKSRKDKLNVYCKVCQNSSSATTQAARTAKYKAAKLQRTPAWADLPKIKEIYAACPSGYHVDHIVPLQGTNVSGFHVEYNLQYLPAKENLAKHNKF